MRFWRIKFKTKQTIQQFDPMLQRIDPKQILCCKMSNQIHLILIDFCGHTGNTNQLLCNGMQLAMLANWLHIRSSCLSAVYLSVILFLFDCTDETAHVVLYSFLFFVAIWK